MAEPKPPRRSIDPIDTGSAFTRVRLQHEIARSRCEIEQHRVLVLTAADKLDKYVAERAIQAHGGMGVTQDTPLGGIYMSSRYCRIADGPDEVHMSQLARRTIRDLL